MGHKIVHGYSPRLQALEVHLEEGAVEEEFHRVLLPRFPRVLVLRELGQQPRARPEAGEVSPRVLAEVGDDVVHDRVEERHDLVLLIGLVDDVEQRRQQLAEEGERGHGVLGHGLPGHGRRIADFLALNRRLRLVRVFGGLTLDLESYK